MTVSIKYDPLKVAMELREQLSSNRRRLGFLFGAGASMAVGLPGIVALTRAVESNIDEALKEKYKKITETLDADSTVEDVLNKVRILKELIGTRMDLEYEGIKGMEEAKALDHEICKVIYDQVQIEPPRGLKPYLTFTQWLHALHGERDWPVEIFTLNYDLLLESSMERIGLPFYDGFIGAVEPFFAPESVEADGSKFYERVTPPRSWTRLWKLHGSLGWRYKKGRGADQPVITRTSGSNPEQGEELMIFPSREKYMDSRKLPFIALQDRFRRFLLSGETLVVIIGYRFADDHINEVIFQALRSNPRLSVVAMIYGEMPEKIKKYGQAYRNLSLIGFKQACIGGNIGDWSKPSRTRKDDENWPFWNENTQEVLLGDFNVFASFLSTFIGFSDLMDYQEFDKEIIESEEVMKEGRGS